MITQERLSDKSQFFYFNRNHMICALSIIGVIGGVVIATIGLCGYLKVPTLKNLTDAETISMMGFGSATAILCIGGVYSCRKFKERRNEQDNFGRIPSQISYGAKILQKPADCVPIVVEILPGLFLANEIGVKRKLPKRLQQLGIIHILSSPSNNSRNVLEKFSYKQIVIASQIEKEAFLSILSEAFSFIEESVQKNEKVVVQCSSGEVLSPVVIIAYLMWKNPTLTFEQVSGFVSTKSYIGDISKFNPFLTPQDLQSVTLKKTAC